MGLPYFSFIINKNSIFLLGFVFVYFFGDHTLCPSVRTDKNIFYRLEWWGSRHIGPLAPVPLFEIYSLFTPHLNWQLTAHQWSSMIICRIKLFFLNSKPFTHTAAILTRLDLRSIVGCPGGMSTIRLVFTSAFRGMFSLSSLGIRLFGNLVPRVLSEPPYW